MELTALDSAITAAIARQTELKTQREAKVTEATTVAEKLNRQLRDLEDGIIGVTAERAALEKLKADLADLPNVQP